MVTSTHLYVSPHSVYSSPDPNTQPGTNHAISKLFSCVSSCFVIIRTAENEIQRDVLVGSFVGQLPCVEVTEVRGWAVCY